MWPAQRTYTSAARTSSVQIVREILACFFFFLLPSQSRPLRVGDDVDPLRVGCSLGVVIVVPVPPLVRRSLRKALGRILPCFLAAERREDEVAPDGTHRFVAAI